MASPRETSLRELCFALLRAVGSPLEPRHAPLPAERKAEISLEEGLASLVRWSDSQRRDV
jgi:hypothetical protein